MSSAMFLSLLFNHFTSSRTVHSTDVQRSVAEQDEFPILGSIPEDVMGSHVLPLLNFREIVRLESAFARHSLKRYFDASVKGLSVCGVVDFRHLGWCTSRRCFGRTLRITAYVDSSFILMPNFRELHLCATAKISEEVLHRILTSGKDLQFLNIQHFYCKTNRQFLPPSSNLSLLEINVSGNRYLPENIVVRIVARCPLLRTIKATDTLRFTDQLPLALAEHCPDLRDVWIRTYRSATQIEMLLSTGYCALFRRCRELKNLDISGVFDVINLQTLADCCSQLRSVALCFSFTANWDEALIIHVNAGLTAFVQNNPLLHTLSISRVPYVTEATLYTIAQYLPALRSFTLSQSAASMDGLAYIRVHCTKLTTFECYMTSVPDPLIYEHLQLGILTTLKINSGTLRDAQLVQLAQTNPHLQKLDVLQLGPVYANPLLSSSALCAALSQWPKLTEFSVEVYPDGNNTTPYSVQFNDVVLFILVRHCPLLTSLNITNRDNLSNDAISILSGLSQLRVFTVRGCVKLLDSGVTAIAEGCPLLEEICLSFCPRISNTSVDALARCCKHLAAVYLRQCTHIEDSCIQNLVRHARHLEKLDIARNPLISFAAVAELPRYCFCMRYLRLYKSCWNVFSDRPFVLEFYASYRNNRHYFDVLFGWSEPEIYY